MAFASPSVLPVRLASAGAAASPLRPSCRRPAKPLRRAPSMVQKNAPVVSTEPSLASLLSSANRFSTLLRILAASQIPPQSLSGTVFAPVNAAFSTLSPELLRTFMSDVQAARQLILRHVVLDVVPTAKLTANGFLPSAFGGPLPYSSFAGLQLKVDGAPVAAYCDQTFDKGVVHAITTVLRPPGQKWPTFAQTYVPPRARAPSVSQSASARARGATKPATVGGRRAMGLIAQQPAWMYGPPYNAAKQEEYEPISVAVPDVSAVDYQLMPPGSVVVAPDSVNALELNPVSGMSKYIGQTKRIVGKDALSDYSRLD